MTSAGDCALVLLLLFRAAFAQDYDVTDIQCTFASGGTGLRDSVAALLRKPEGFRGAPLFADDRATDPLADPVCQIRPEPEDSTGLLYRLKITDFTRCGVLKRNGFVHVRVWFPQFPGVVMQSDQELIIMCKPPEPTIIENKAAGFAGSFPHGARVSGVVEETPGRLEYEVALYKEAPPVTRHNNHSVDLPVDQAVPIGTKLQLRARINPDSAWRHIKLLEVAVSPDPDRPHAPGAVLLVKDGCRNRDFASIIPHQPARYRERHNEVFLDFEAFLLASMKERSTLWIHSQIKACMDAADCQPDYCLDLFEPSVSLLMLISVVFVGIAYIFTLSSYKLIIRPTFDTFEPSTFKVNGSEVDKNILRRGHGRRRRSLPEVSHSHNITSSALVADNSTTPFTRFKENLEYSVVMPGELFHRTPIEATCATSMMVAVVLGALLFMSALLMCYLATKLNSTMLKNSNLQSPSGKGFEQILRELAHHSLPDTGYTGRPTVQ